MSKQRKTETREHRSSKLIKQVSNLQNNLSSLKKKIIAPEKALPKRERCTKKYPK